MPTILITGCSSGFGLDIAKYFLARDWHVIATMRTPREDLFPASPLLRLLALDVTNAASMSAALAEAGPIDVLVNNAGVGWLNAVEGTPMEVARTIFETNTIGTMAMTQAVLPQFRARRSGVVVNVTSTVTLRPLPLLSIYSASKAAVNAFTESLALELKEFNIQVRLVLPGRAPDTRFGDNARAKIQENGGFHEAYAGQVERIVANWAQDAGPVTHSEDVAEAVWRAVTDETAPMRIPAGADAVIWAAEAENVLKASFTS